MSMPQSVRPAHSAADHQFVVQHVVAHDVERMAAVDPLPHQVGLRRRQPRVAIAHQEAADRRDRSSPESAETGRRRDIRPRCCARRRRCRAGRRRRPRHGGIDIEAAAPARIDRAAEHQIDHGAVAVERRGAPQRKRNDVVARRRAGRARVKRDRQRLAAGLGVAQVERALAVADRLVDLAGVEIARP